MAPKAETVQVKNVSEETQMFTGFPPFAPGEVREVTAEEAEILERSPFMELTKKPSTVKGKESEKTFKGVETE